MDKVIEIREKYSKELDDINNIINKIKNERYYDKSGIKTDGYLTNNISELKKKITDLITKIEYNKESSGEHIANELLKHEI